ncbi:hypothetical protein MMC10_007004 [Thelotrema lepadinum]|nr:hypothetical protein [Thelotrema lepadinum]
MAVQANLSNFAVSDALRRIDSKVSIKEPEISVQPIGDDALETSDAVSYSIVTERLPEDTVQLHSELQSANDNSKQLEEKLAKAERERDAALLSQKDLEADNQKMTQEKADLTQKLISTAARGKRYAPQQYYHQSIY